MKGSAKVIQHLNTVLVNELTAINQFFLHARMLQNWGFQKLEKQEYAASIDEMKHADDIIKRILFLDGIPNVQMLHKVNIGQDVSEMLLSDRKVELKAIDDLKAAISDCELEKDYVSRDLFAKILESEEEHIDWLDTQIDLMEKVGVQNYLQSQMMAND